MSTVTRPRGPLPARVYWTRRLLLLLVALALVLGVARLLGGGGGDDPGTPSARPVGAELSPTTSEPGPTGSPADVLQTTPGTADKPAHQKKKAKPTPTPLAEPSGPCVTSDVTVSPAVKGEARAGSPVLFALGLTTSEPACTFEVSASTLVVKLTSGSDRIWSTQDCTGAVPKQSVVLREGMVTTVHAAWHGQRSDATCSRTTPWALPGYYHVAAAVLGSEPTDQQFRLLKPVRPTITPSPKPAKKKSEQKSKQKPATR
jgi:hypothetical protein